MDVTSLSAPIPNRAHAPQSLRQTALALEGAFLSEMLKSAGAFQAASEMGGGSGEAHFSSFLADAHARAMVARGGIGLADAIEVSLSRQNLLPGA